MPTGYTADVKDGKVTDLADFVLTCARGFGALITLRDSDQSLEATRRYIADGTYLGASNFYVETLDKERKRLAELSLMSDKEALAAAQAAADEQMTRNAEFEAAEFEAERVAAKERYEAMLAKVEAWEPPTADHMKFKEFMVEQITQSIDFDCRPFEMPVPAVSIGWRDVELAKCRENITRYEGEIVKENERNAGRKAWVEALLDSLEGVPA